jgi:acetoin utilization protein AcuB
MRVREVMSGGLLTIEPSASCHDAVQRMFKNQVRHLPVVGDDDRLLGVITDRDVRHHLFTPDVFGKLAGTDVLSVLRGVSVRDVMSSPAVTTSADADVTDAARTMRQAKVGSVPVVDRGRVIGIVTESDLLRELVRMDRCCSPEVEAIVVSFP